LEVSGQLHAPAAEKDPGTNWIGAGLDNVDKVFFFFFVIPFNLQSVPVHSANCVKHVYSGM
jgi:hypothetical protein